MSAATEIETNTDVLHWAWRLDIALNESTEAGREALKEFADAYELTPWHSIDSAMMAARFIGRLNTAEPAEVLAAGLAVRNWSRADLSRRVEAAGVSDRLVYQALDGRNVRSDKLRTLFTAIRTAPADAR